MERGASLTRVRNDPSEPKPDAGFGGVEFFPAEIRRKTVQVTMDCRVPQPNEGQIVAEESFANNHACGFDVERSRALRLGV